jgi:hypothetical protein
MSQHEQQQGAEAGAGAPGALARAARLALLPALLACSQRTPAPASDASLPGNDARPRAQPMPVDGAAADAPVPAGPAIDAAADASGDTSGTPPVDAPSPAGACDNGGGGLQGTYFDNTELANPAFAQIEPTLVFDWGRDRPAGLPAPAAGAAGWSAVLTGTLQPVATDTYTFIARADDGFRLFIDGDPVIDWWHPHCCYDLLASRALVAGQRYAVRIEYFNRDGPAAFRLLWKTATTLPAEIPQCQLFPGPPGAAPCAPGLGDCRTTVEGFGCGAGGTGLEGLYFARENFTGGGVPRLDGPVSFHWDEQPPIEGVAAALYAVRWEGFLLPPSDETFTFSLLADASAKLWIGNQAVVDTAQTGPGWEAEGRIALRAGERVPIRIDFAKTRRHGFIKLRWKTPTLPRTVIPRCRLFEPQL